MSVLRAFPIVLAALTSPAQAQPISGNQLLEYCRSKDPAIQGYCLGYLAGVTEGLVRGAAGVLVATSENGLLSSDDVNQALRFCIPPSVTAQQENDVVVTYISRNAQSRHYPARQLAVQAYQEAFPCN